MGAGLFADGDGGPETPHAERSAPPSRTSSPAICLLRPTLAAIERSTTVIENVVVEASERHDAEQGYPWRWEVVYGEQHRSGACQTRVQAEREAATVLVLLKGADGRGRELACSPGPKPRLANAVAAAAAAIRGIRQGRDLGSCHA